MREIKKFFNKMKVLHSKWNVLWYAINTDDKRVQAELKNAEINLKKSIEIKNKLKKLDPKDAIIYNNIADDERFPAKLHEGLFKASRSIRKSVELEKEQLELCNKKELYDGIVDLLNKYIDKKIDLGARIKERHSGLKDIYLLEAELKRAFNVKYVG